MKPFSAILASFLLWMWVQPTAAATPQARQAARQHFQRGEKEYKLGHFEKALQAYSQAYDVLPLPGFLFNIGQCHRKLGHFERAIFFYRGYLREKPQAANRQVVEQLIADSQRELAAARERKRKAELAAQRERERKAALAEQRRQAEEERRRMEKQLALEKARAEAAAAAARAAEMRRQERGTPIYATWWFWTVLGVVVAGAATGTALALTAESEKVPPAGSLGTVDWTAVRF
jgi:tetratricopeptide (TPR) repeat protein